MTDRKPHPGGLQTGEVMLPAVSTLAVAELVHPPTSQAIARCDRHWSGPDPNYVAQR